MTDLITIRKPTSKEEVIFLLRRCSFLADDLHSLVDEIFPRKPWKADERFYVSGPSCTALVEKEKIEETIAALCKASGDDPDDYTATSAADWMPKINTTILGCL